MLTTLGPWGLVSMFVALVFLGGLVPRWLHNQRVADKEQQIKALQAMVDKRDEQVDKLIKSSELTISLLEDIKRAGTDTNGETRPRR